VIVGDINMTADGSLLLYAAAYDASDNFLFDVNSSWSTTGTLDDIIATPLTLLDQITVRIGPEFTQ